MTEPLNITQILDEKLQLESKVYDLMTDFMKRTGLTVDDVQLSYLTYADLGRPYISNVLTKVSMSISLP